MQSSRTPASTPCPEDRATAPGGTSSKSHHKDVNWTGLSKESRIEKDKPTCVQLHGAAELDIEAEVHHDHISTYTEGISPNVL